MMRMTSGLHLTSQAVVIAGAVVSDSGQLIRRRIGGEPLLDRKERLLARDVSPRGCDLQVVTVPPVVRTRSVGGQVQSADRGGQARAASAENVEIASLKVVVSRTHQPAPRLQITDLDPVPIRIVQSDRHF